MRLFETTHEGAWKLLFKGNEKPPTTCSDHGHDCKHPASEVCYFLCTPNSIVSRKTCELLLQLFQDWMERAKRIQCPAPLPEEPVIPRLAKMLVSAPYKVPEKKAKKRAKGAKSGPRRKGTSDVTSEDDEAHSSVPEDNDEEEEENNPPPEEEKKKRAALAHPEAKAPKKGKGVPAVNTAWDVDSSPERPCTKPHAAS